MTNTKPRVSEGPKLRRFLRKGPAEEGAVTLDRRVSKACDILAKGWNKRVALTELSANVGLSPSRLEHLFKTEVGVSIREYVLAHRLEVAAYLLAASDLRVKEICYRVGFGDLSGFDHLFKRKFGVKPSDYRSGCPNLQSDRAAFGNPR